MANETIYVVDLVQAYNNEPIHNMFTYHGYEDGTAAELSVAFKADVLPAINAIQCSVIINRLLKVYSLGNLGDIDEDALTGGGTSSLTDMLPLHDAINFTLKPTSRVVRAGSKRFAGIPEEAVTYGVVSSSGYLTLLNALKSAINLPISDDETNFYDPIIVKRIKYLPDGNEEPNFAYRYPTSSDPEVFATLRSVLLNTKVSHQVSRGNGK